MGYLQALMSALLMCSLVLLLAAEDGESLQGIPGGTQRLATPSKHNGEERQQRAHRERRGVALAGHYPFPHQVTCKDAEGQPQTYKSKDCLSAAKKMSAYHLSEVTCSTCKLSVVSSNGEPLKSAVPADRLQHMTVEILKACASNKSINATYSAEESRGNKVVQIVFTLLLSQGNGTR
ncbi:hypothetical protein PGT21_010477 [Puccinia graminis f. sp. tritici]|uniref:Uncharacterized protein n=1 Tax=Puccinia graminis f. sp. tritici TaxID=56615 RepID=A0A5B0R061_PUCGR|nr:hypothetical protein PGT21_010477 [Puccinia graminis f. sp. tritici]